MKMEGNLKVLEVYLQVLSREQGNTLYRCYKGILFPSSLLRTSTFRMFGAEDLRWVVFPALGAVHLVHLGSGRLRRARMREKWITHIARIRHDLDSLIELQNSDLPRIPVNPYAF